MIDLETIKWRLAETIAWCTNSTRVNLDDYDYQNCLRSPELDPHLDLDALDEYWGRGFIHDVDLQKVDDLYGKRMWKERHEAKIGSFQAAMAKLAVKRAHLLRKTHHYPNASVEKLKTGRLLLYFPHRNTVSGEVTNETENFFDDYHIPPWDTWVNLWIAEEPNQNNGIFILSWIPSQFEDLVSAGIGVNMLLDIEWTDELDRDFYIEDIEMNKLWPGLEALLAQLKPE